MMEIIEKEPWHFKVRSANKRKYYDVVKRKDETFSCNCLSAKYNADECKHVIGVKGFQ